MGTLMRTVQDVRKIRVSDPEAGGRWQGWGAVQGFSASAPLAF